jgi:iron uptake system component EfeO
LGAIVVLIGCGESDDTYRADVGTQMREALSVDIHDVVVQARALQDAAPTPQGRGWDAQQDAMAIQSMKLAWLRARDAYEHVEGAVAPLLPALDFPIDSRYEAFLARAGDAYAFDDQGVVGLDAVERIVWADVTPQPTIDYEKTIAGYFPAAFPSTEKEASDFKNVLCAKLVADAMALEAAWSKQTIDVGAAYGGLVSLVTEQRDEIALWKTSAQESRYSQSTMNDLRANIEGIESIYGIFRPWITSKNGGSDADAKIEAGIVAIESSYAGVSGNTLPNASSAEYMQLLDGLTSSALAADMNRARGLVGF